MEQPPGESSLGHPADINTGNYETWKSSAFEFGVVVVGGGVAGLTAAKTLLENDIKDILLLEADARVGGRVWTHREGNIFVEQGAEWIHGGKRNHLYRLAHQLNEVTPTIPDSAWDEKVVTNDGEPTDPSKYEIVEDLMDQADNNGILRPYYHTGYGQFYIDRFPEAYGEGWDSNLGQAWLHLLEKTVNSEEGTNNWLDISARDADEFVAKGRDHHWKNGFDTVVNHLRKSIPGDIIRTSSPVCKIFWDEDDSDDDDGGGGGGGRVLLVTNNGRTSYSAKHVIVSVSVGHLKERHQKLFQPALPAAFVENLNAIDLGVADKIQIGWEEPWWGSQDPCSLSILWTERNLPKDMEWLYGVVGVFSVRQQVSVLQTFVTGEEAQRMEDLPEDTVKQHFMHLLVHSTRLHVPQPTFFTRSRWGRNPWTRGSYSSYVTTEGDKAGFRKREKLAIPLINSKGRPVLLWAGEHTHNTRYGTVDGAMEVGRQEAMTLVQLINDRGRRVKTHNNNVL